MPTPPASRTRPTRHPSRRSRRRIGAATVAVVASAALLAGCFSANQTKMVGYINASRSAARKPSVTGNSQAMAKAQAWAEHMARTGVVEHSGGGGRLSTSGLPRWCAVGENVGSGTSTKSLHDHFMASPGHRANVLGSYNRVGTGVVRKGNLVYGVEIYYRAC